MEASAVTKQEALSSAFLQRAHAAFFGHLALSDRMVEGHAADPGVMREKSASWPGC